jgi:hypothetical protein
MSLEDKIEELILAGAVEVAGIDAKTGEFLYSFTDKIAEIDPEIARHSEMMFNQTLAFLWERGFLSINMAEENPLVSLTEKALDEDAVASLDVNTRLILSSIIEALRL